MRATIRQVEPAALASALLDEAEWRDVTLLDDQVKLYDTLLSMAIEQQKVHDAARKYGSETRNTRKAYDGKPGDDRGKNVSALTKIKRRTRNTLLSVSNARKPIIELVIADLPQMRRRKGQWPNGLKS